MTIHFSTHFDGEIFVNSLIGDAIGTKLQKIEQSFILGHRGNYPQTELIVK